VETFSKASQLASSSHHQLVALILRSVAALGA
jgi:hypothetical protein